MESSGTLTDFSLVRGGPFQTLGRGLRGVEPGRSGLFALVLALGCWGPLVLLAWMQGGSAPRLLVRDLQVHGELLLSLPVLVAAGPYIDRRLGAAARQFLRASLVGERGRGALEALARRCTRWCDSSCVELLILGWVIAFAWLTSPDPSRPWQVSDSARPSLAGGWYLCVAQPLVRFLVLRWLWRGVVWAVFLLRVSRLPLRLSFTHPDQSGGLGFLAVCQASFAPVVFAVAVPVAAYSFRVNAGAITESPLDYVMPQVLYAVLACLAVFAPLACFFRPLVAAKRRGDPWYSAVAAHHSREFEDRWFQQKPEGSPLGSPDFSSLADLGSSFMVARKMKLFPWDQRGLLAVGAAGLAPLVILLMVDRQFIAVVNQLRQSMS
ncbi:hypothetical protein LXT21_23895 [Myxococcus sp. K38C18041901]|uniref:hypothetical protein n=1 Tax=Myxococcus guangdongensis TaxID=2906760 RepID=UPI0020A701FA|nr:hypothetical protein [Myxococcus guangdongensis]MCP3061831.1 hypothetical protein [Myxococcus guangdongensis]